MSADRVSRILSRVPEPLVALGAHAAVPVALDPAYVHLLRTNFFLDPPGPILEYSDESRLLLSPLCREIGDGLYEIPPDVRTALLRHLHQNFGPQRIREVATLLWQYCERGPWTGRPELERAQQLAALSCIDPYRARTWLNEKDPGSETVERKWFVAMQEEIEGIQKDTTEPARADLDVKALAENLLRLDFVAQVETAVTAMRDRQFAAFLLHGPQDHAQTWVMRRILKSVPADRARAGTGTPLIVTIDVTPAFMPDGTRPFAAALGNALGVSVAATSPTGRHPWVDVAEALAARVRTQSVVVVLNGIDRANNFLAGSVVSDFWGGVLWRALGSRPSWSPHTGLYLFLVDHKGTFGAPGSLFGGESTWPFFVRLPVINRFSTDDLLHWLSVSAEALPVDVVASPPAMANEILEKSDRGIPQRALEYIAWRVGVPWAQVDAAVATSETSAAGSPSTSVEPLMALAREYDQIRETQEPGGERSEAMRSVAARMRPVSAVEAAAIQSLTTSSLPGDRLAAIVALTGRPDAGWLTWLADRLRPGSRPYSDPSAGESPFIGLQAALALEQAARLLPETEPVKAAIDQARARLGSAFSRSDRREALDWADTALGVRTGRWSNNYSPLAQEYDQMRRFEPSGDQRTEKLDRLAVQMTKLPQPAPPLWTVLMNSPSAGMRLQAIAALYQSPDVDGLGWLADRPRFEKAFLGYWATVALARAAEVLDVAHADAIRAALVTAGAGQRISGDPNQAEMITRGEQALQTRTTRRAEPPAPNAPITEGSASPDAPDRTSFTGAERRRLCDALLQAFGTRDDLEMLVSFNLDLRLGDIVSRESSLAQTVFEMVEALEMRGQTAALLRAALKERPQNPALAAVASELLSGQPASTSRRSSGSDRPYFNGPELARIGDALLTAFSRWEIDQLASMLDIRLDSVVRPDLPLNQTILELLKATEAYGRTSDLIRVALQERPNSPEIVKLAAGLLTPQRGTPSPGGDVPPAAQPSASRRAQQAGRSLMGAKLWQPGQVIRIAFLDGTPELRERVKQVATEWTRAANLTFDFSDTSTKASPGQIRITFKGESPWSYIGTDALQVAEREPTMSFGGVSRGPIGEWDSEILREFGHALGLVSEHQNPNARIPWNREVVTREMSGPPNNWSKETIDQNLFNVYPTKKGDWYRDFDPHSVMMRHFSPTWFTGPFDHGYSNNLSESDREFVAQLYPHGETTNEAPPPATFRKAAPRSNAAPSSKAARPAPRPAVRKTAAKKKAAKKK